MDRESGEQVWKQAGVEVGEQEDCGLGEQSMAGEEGVFADEVNAFGFEMLNPL